MADTIRLPARDAIVVARSDVVVVGGGPAGLAAAVAAARNGASVTLLERYAHLGGMAAGGMVLLLDDMVNGLEITVRGLATEIIERMTAMGLAVTAPESAWGLSQDGWHRWSRWGVFDYTQAGRIKPIVYATAFDPDGWKRAALAMLAEAGVNYRLHSWFSEPIMDGDRIRGVVSETKQGRQAVLADVVIDASGDADVALAAGAPTLSSNYMVTTVFRLGNVDTAAAEAHEQAHPREAEALNREAKRILGGSWALWWLKTPLRGVIWCNCPHMTGYDGTSVEDLTAADADGRGRIERLVAYARANLPGFGEAFVVDVAPQIGVRQTRMIQGEYVVTRSDVHDRRHFADSVARGRDYYTPYRALVPRGVEGLLVAGRHYSADPEAQKLSREIPPCMAMGQATGVAATMALSAGVPVRAVDVAAVQRRLREQGADPGDVPSANALVNTRLRGPGRRTMTSPDDPADPDDPAASSAPLAGIRVLDFSQIMQGPAATQVLGDFGADVIKVERPKGGDIFRWSLDDPAGLDHPAFVSLNRNKRSLAVDLATDEGRSIVQRLARDCDVVVSNFRPGVMERLGLGYEQLSVVNPGVIWAVGLGYGSSGPYVAKGGQDMLAQAYSGAMSHLLDGWEPRVYPVSLADYSTGMHLVQGILLALLARAKNGRGQRIECSLYDSMLAMQMLEAAMVLNGRQPLNWAGLPLNGTFVTTDGAIVLVGAFKPNPLRDICAALDIEDLSLRPELRTQTDQMAHRPMLQARFRERFATNSTAHWLERLEAQDLLCAPVRVLGEALEDEQTAVNGMLLEMDHAALGRVRVVASPLHLSETGPELRRAAPRLGADSADVLAELGYDEAHIAALRATGVIGG